MTPREENRLSRQKRKTAANASGRVGREKGSERRVLNASGRNSDPSSRRISTTLPRKGNAHALNSSTAYGFDIGRVCKGAHSEHVARGQIHGGGLEPMEHGANGLWYDVDGYPAGNTDTTAGQLITNHTRRCGLLSANVPRLGEISDKGWGCSRALLREVVGTGIRCGLTCSSR